MSLVTYKGWRRIGGSDIPLSITFFIDLTFESMAICHTFKNKIKSIRMERR